MSVNKRHLEMIDATLMAFLMIKGLRLLTGEIHGEPKDVLRYLTIMEERFTTVKFTTGKV